jgi:hypothetical protein
MVTRFTAVSHEESQMLDFARSKRLKNTYPMCLFGGCAMVTVQGVNIAIHKDRTGFIGITPVVPPDDVDYVPISLSPTTVRLSPDDPPQLYMIYASLQALAYRNVLKGLGIRRSTTRTSNNESVKNDYDRYYAIRQ